MLLGPQMAVYVWHSETVSACSLSLPLCSVPSPDNLKLSVVAIFTLEKPTNATKPKQGLFFSRKLVVDHRLDHQLGSNDERVSDFIPPPQPLAADWFTHCQGDRKPMKTQQENGNKPQEEFYPVREIVLVSQWLDNVPPKYMSTWSPCELIQRLSLQM